MPPWRRSAEARARACVPQTSSNPAPRSTISGSDRPAQSPEAGRCRPTRTRALELRRRAVAANPRILPVRDLALVLGDVRAPGLGDDGALGLPHDRELAVGLHLA